MTDIVLPTDKLNNPIQAMGVGTTQVISFGPVSFAIANALSKNTIIIRLVATAPCHVAIGTGTPTATSTSMYLPAGVPEYFSVNGFQTLKVAAVQNATAGVLYVTEMT
jgi:hypothetical protein